MSLQFPVGYDSQIYKGSYFQRKFVYKIAENPVDLTVYTARSQIRTSLGSSTIVLTPTCTIPNPLNGEIIMEILATDSTPITVMNGVYDLEIVPASGESKATRLVMGNVVFSKQATLP